MRWHLAAMGIVAGLLASGCGEREPDTGTPLTTAAAAGRCSGGTDGTSSEDIRRWRSDRPPAGGDPTLRQLIADRLIICSSLTGATRTRVEALLGEPVRPDSVPDEWVYVTGAERSDVQLDSEYLIVQFDGGDRVKGLRLSAP